MIERDQIVGFSFSGNDALEVFIVRKKGRILIMGQRATFGLFRVLTKNGYRNVS
jgi:hypothetical protein